MRVDAKLERDAIRWLVADNPGHIIQPFRTVSKTTTGVVSPNVLPQPVLTNAKIVFYPNFKKATPEVLFVFAPSDRLVEVALPAKPKRVEIHIRQSRGRGGPGARRRVGLRAVCDGGSVRDP